MSDEQQPGSHTAVSIRSSDSLLHFYKEEKENSVSDRSPGYCSLALIQGTNRLKDKKLAKEHLITSIKKVCQSVFCNVPVCQ